MGDEDLTPPAGIRIASSEAIILANLASALNNFANQLASSAGAIDALEGDKRRVFIKELADHSRAAGDFGHEVGRALEDYLKASDKEE